jgi:hypothetical protein
MLDDIFDGMDTESINELTDLILDPALPWTVIIGTRSNKVALKCSQQVSMDQTPITDQP